MKHSSKNIQLDTVMETLNINAVMLSRLSNVDASIINKWRRGSRKITNRSVALISVAKALIELDTEQQLKQYYSPYQTEKIGSAEALADYLLGEDLPNVLSHVTMEDIPKSGIYSLQYHIYLGKKGYRKAAIDMLDYSLMLPPGQTISVLCHGDYNWIVDNMPFVLQFLRKMQKVFAQNTRLLIIARKNYKIGDSRVVAIPWLVAHLLGHIRSIYYEEEIEEDDILFVASIDGYWSAKAIEEPTVEDNIRLRICTDPYETKKDAAMCDALVKKSILTSQYDFFSSPQGNEENKKIWKQGALPQIENEAPPNGSFNAFCKVPGLGIITKDEFKEISGVSDLSFIPDFLFNTDGTFADANHRIILCRDDIKEALSIPQRKHEVMSLLLGKDIMIKREQLVMQLERLLLEMERNDDFQIALIPRVAFSKLKLEVICWEKSVTVGWLQNSDESVISIDHKSHSFHDSIAFVWEKSLAGWKRKSSVSKTLRNWIAGKGLGDIEKNSAIVQNWAIIDNDE